MKNPEDIVSVQEAAISLAIDVHGNRSKTLQVSLRSWRISYQSSRNTTHNVESLRRTIGSEPVVDEIGETVEEEVFEDHGHDENLVCVVTVSIQSVRRRGDSGDGDSE